MGRIILSQTVYSMAMPLNFYLIHLPGGELVTLTSRDYEGAPPLSQSQPINPQIS